MFVPAEDIEKNLKNAELVLAEYNTDNLEKFAQQVDNVPKKDELIKLAKTLRELKEDYNVARLLSYDNLIQKIKSKDISQLLNTVQDRIRTINLIQEDNSENRKDILNTAMNNWIFEFEKGGSEELKLVADDYRKEEETARQILKRNWDKKDPEWVDLFEEFKRIMKKQHINETTVDETKANTAKIKAIIFKMKNLNFENERIAQAFDGDKKYARSYKKVVYDPTNKNTYRISDHPSIYYIMKNSKNELDDEVAKNTSMLSGEAFFNKRARQALILSNKNLKHKVKVSEIKDISNLLTKEYYDEHEGKNN